MRLLPALLLFLFSICTAWVDEDGNEITQQEWLQLKIEVATGSETGDGTTASTPEESGEVPVEPEESDSSDYPEDPNYCPTEYEGSALPETVEMLDITGSDESLRDQASSGFDDPGVLVVEENPAVYEVESGVTVCIPVDSPAEEVKEGEVEGEEE